MHTPKGCPSRCQTIKYSDQRDRSTLTHHFGIAKVLEEEGQLTLTETGVGMGTQYMAPEQGLETS